MRSLDCQLVKILGLYNKLKHNTLWKGPIYMFKFFLNIDSCIMNLFTLTQYTVGEDIK